MDSKTTYTVEWVDRAFGPRDAIPWGFLHAEEDYDSGRGIAGWKTNLSVSQAVKLYNAKHRWYHPQGGDGYSGHVRILGSDRWTYAVEPPSLGERATLSRQYHLDDIS